MPNVWRSTMNEKTFKRDCPHCGKILQYKSRPVYNRAKRIGRGCRGCGQVITKVQNGYKSSWNMGLTIEDKRVANNCRNAFGKDGNISTENKGKSYIDVYGLERAIEIKNKMRDSRGTCWPNYNPKSIPIIEQYAEEHGYNFQHAENGGEVAFITESGNQYYVDGYDREKNTIIEFYERWHKRTDEYDSIRKEELIKLLNCKFIIINE